MKISLNTGKDLRKISIKNRLETHFPIKRCDDRNTVWNNFVVSNKKILSLNVFLFKSCDSKVFGMQLQSSTCLIHFSLYFRKTYIRLTWLWHITLPEQLFHILTVVDTAWTFYKFLKVAKFIHHAFSKALRKTSKHWNFTDSIEFFEPPKKCIVNLVTIRSQEGLCNSFLFKCSWGLF